MRYFMGCDIGTSGAKAVLFDERGQAIAQAGREYPLYQPQAGWAEQDPEDWWRASAAAMGEAVARAGVQARQVVSVGLSGQMHGLVLLDRENRVLRPAILWCDQRTAAECADLERIVGAERLAALSGNRAVTGFTASKLLWVRRYQPEVYAKCAHILLPKDYVRYRLTGELATDVSDASGTQLLDVSARRWSGELLKKLGVSPGLLPPVYESCAQTGRVAPCAAAETGLAAGTVVGGGAGDQAAAAVGNGVVRTGVISCNLGSSGVVFAHTDRPLPDGQGRIQTFCHAVPGCWHVMGVTQGAGLSVKWFKDNFYTYESREMPEVYEEINRQIDALPPGAEGLIYLPYLMGERSPHPDPNARGVFFGLTARHTKAHFARAVMEGVTYSLRDCLDVMRERGVTGEVRVCGGGARSPVWRQMLADVFGCRVSAAASEQAGALGAAILSAVAEGAFPDVAAACAEMVPTADALEPDKARGARYEAAYRVYRNLYPTLKQTFEEIAKQ